MRKYLLVAGLVMMFTATGSVLAAGKTTQEISGKTTPSKLAAKKPAGVSLELSETTGTTDPSGVQPATASARILLDKDISLTTAGLPRCGIADIAGKSTAAARAACGDARVGSGSVVARVSDGGDGHVDFHGKVTAFNGKRSAELPTDAKSIMILHIVIGGSTALDVPMSIESAAGAYGTELATLPGDDAEPIRNLTLKLHRSYTVHGKRKHFVSARCSHGKLRYKGKFTYVGSPPLTATSSQRCTVKR